MRTIRIVFSLGLIAVFAGVLAVRPLGVRASSATIRTTSHSALNNSVTPDFNFSNDAYGI